MSKICLFESAIFEVRGGDAVYNPGPGEKIMFHPEVKPYTTFSVETPMPAELLLMHLHKAVVPTNPEVSIVSEFSLMGEPSGPLFYHMCFRPSDESYMVKGGFMLSREGRGYHVFALTPMHAHDLVATFHELVCTMYGEPLECEFEWPPQD